MLVCAFYFTCTVCVCVCVCVAVVVVVAVVAVVLLYFGECVLVPAFLSEILCLHLST